MDIGSAILWNKNQNRRWESKETNSLELAIGCFCSPHINLPYQDLICISQYCLESRVSVMKGQPASDSYYMLCIAQFLNGDSLSEMQNSLLCKKPFNGLSLSMWENIF